MTELTFTVRRFWQKLYTEYEDVIQNAPNENFWVTAWHENISKNHQETTGQPLFMETSTEGLVILVFDVLVYQPPLLDHTSRLRPTTFDDFRLPNRCRLNLL